jgi:hypothetical protein
MRTFEGKVWSESQNSHGEEMQKKKDRYERFFGGAAAAPDCFLKHVEQSPNVSGLL